MSFPEGVSWGLGEASVAEIDDLNILQASLLAMERAVAALPLSPAVALVDGLHPPRLPCLAIPVVRGDSLSISIGAASIGAKVHRDRLMESLALEYPGYGWEKNAGYGTALHRQGLAQLGVSPHHRRSFKPIRALLPSA
jgi:ribonuclease HII